MCASLLLGTPLFYRRYDIILAASTTTFATLVRTAEFHLTFVYFLNLYNLLTVFNRYRIIHLTNFRHRLVAQLLIDMKAYWYNDAPVSLDMICCAAVQMLRFCQGDQREEHDSGRSVSEEFLSNLGVLYRRCPSLSSVDAIASERSYKNRDEIVVSPESMGSQYEAKVKMFFVEHLHEDEEIRYILDGQGFFDVRDGKDDWIRIMVEKDDLIILPAGLYHRFTTNSNNVCSTIFDFHLVCRH